MFFVVPVHLGSYFSLHRKTGKFTQVNNKYTGRVDMCYGEKIKEREECLAEVIAISNRMVKSSPERAL